MKRVLLMLVLWGGFVAPAQAAISVVDIGLIKTNLINAKRDLVEQVLQGQRQVEQIRHMVAQIQQIESYLDRFGDPEAVTVAALQEAAGFLRGLELNKTAEEIVQGASGEEVVDQGGGSPYADISREVLIEGQPVASRDLSVFTPEVAARRSFRHYDEVQAAALSRRKAIKGQIDAALTELRAATTASEVAKIDVVIRSLESQLAATDNDIQFAASQALLRYYRNRIEEDVQARARVQQKRAELESSVEREVRAFVLPSQPLLFKR